MLERLRAMWRQLRRPPLHSAEIDLPYSVLGSDYGGWPLLRDQTPASPLVFSFGVGEDATFDVAAIEQFGAAVHAFDPTPRSLAWVESQTFPRGFSFHNIGLGARDGIATFFAPENSAHVSYSASPALRSDDRLAIEAPIERLTTVVARVGQGPPDVLKMDIEGFEYEVLEDLLVSDLRPSQLLIEFHHRMYGIPTARTERAVSELRRAGYRLFYVSRSGHEYGFVHQP